MKAILKNALALALPLALAACGGGGGGDNNAPADKPNTGDNNMVTPPGNKPSTNNAGLTPQEMENLANVSLGFQPEYPEQIVGMIGVAKRNNLMTGKISPESFSRVSGIGFSYIFDTPVGTINVPDEPEKAHQIGDVDLYKDYQYHGYGQSYRYFVVSDKGYAAVQFGVASSADATDPVLGLFFRGKTTPEDLMPKSGTASYQGQVVFLPDLFPAPVTPVGKIAANVDFGNKNMSVLVTAPNDYEGRLDAKISGSAFMGRSGQKEILGIFAGNSAGEMSGTYTDSSAPLIGVFGAKRQ